jgi:hypothetical protein
VIVSLNKLINLLVAEGQPSLLRISQTGYFNKFQC